LNRTVRRCKKDSSLSDDGLEKAVEQKIIKIINPKTIYLNRLKKLIDTSILSKAKLKIGVDLLYGSGIGYLDTFLQEAIVGLPPP